MLLSYRVEDDYGATEAHATFARKDEPAAKGDGPHPLYGPPDFSLVLPQARTRNGVAQTIKDVRRCRSSSRTISSIMSVQEDTNAAEHLAHLPPPRRSAHNGQSHSPATMKLLRRLGFTYVAAEELTIRRLRHGRGFRYVAADGTPLRGEESQRLAALAPSILRLGPGLSFRRRRLPTVCPSGATVASRWVMCVLGRAARLRAARSKLLETLPRSPGHQILRKANRRRA